MKLCLIVLASLCSEPLMAGKYNPTLNIGDSAPVWTSLPGTDGKNHSREDLKDSKVIVVAFLCNSCPYAVDCEERLNTMTKAYRDKNVSVVAINVNTIQGDKLEAMTERAKEQKFEFQYLFDESQQIATDFGATYTPEFFVLNQERKIAYMGSFDDDPAGKKVQVEYVSQAVDAVLEGKVPDVTETIAIGCRIRMNRRR